MKAKIERMKELVAQLNIYRDSYYNRQESLISDKEYDALFDELEALETETGTVMANSPTQTVGFEVKSKLEKVKHSHPMLSLGKTKDVNDLIKFAGDKDCILSLKMDGLTCLLLYENGELVQAETRGDSEIGELITHNAKVFENIPLTIPYKGHFEVEGEAVICLDDFNRINASLPEGTEPYKTPRNLASGSVRQLDSKITKDRHIKFIAWKVPTPLVGDRYLGKNNYFFGRLVMAEMLGFEIVPMRMIDANNDINDLSFYIENLKRVAKEKGYPIDGMVLTYNDIKYGESLGATGHHPKHSIAFKFYDEKYETELLDIEYSMGKTGILTPVAIFKPVEIDGTMVERASLSNLSVMENILHIPYPGQKISVVKKNQIIPWVVDAEKKDYEEIKDIFIPIPTKCPICGKNTHMTKENDSAVLECTNPNCKGKLLGKLTHFCSKEAMNIEGLSESTLEKFIELGWVSTLGDIYALDMFANEMKKLEGFGERSVKKLLSSIEKSKVVTLDKFICSLSIPLIGRTASKTIAKYFNYDWVEYMNECESGFDFSKLDDFGKVMADSMDEYLDHHFYEMCMIADHFTFTKPKTTSTSTSLSGLTFVVTGSVNIFKNRNDLKENIEQLGGKVAGSVSKNTDFLINNDTESNSSKNKKAKELGVKIISEAEFIKMIS